MHMKKCSTLNVIREIQLKTMMRYHYIPTRMGKIWNTDNNKCWRGYGATQALIHCWWACNTPLHVAWKTLWQSLTKPNTLSPYNPAITFLDIYSNSLKTYIHTKSCTCTQMFIAALFRTAKTRKQPTRPSVSEWVNNLWHSTVMEYQMLKKK